MSTTRVTSSFGSSSFQTSTTSSEFNESVAKGHKFGIGIGAALSFVLLVSIVICLFRHSFLARQKREDRKGKGKAPQTLVALEPVVANRYDRNFLAGGACEDSRRDVKTGETLNIGIEKEATKGIIGTQQEIVGDIPRSSGGGKEASYEVEIAERDDDGGKHGGEFGRKEGI